MRNWPSLIIVSVGLFIWGCTPLLRSARIDDGLSVALTAGIPLGAEIEKGDEASRFPFGQFEIRGGGAATKNRWGKTIGVIVPWYVPWYVRGSSLELYFEMPRRYKFNMGFGGQIGIVPNVFHIVSFPLGREEKVEFFLSNRLLIGVLGFEEKDGRAFLSYNIAVGSAFRLGTNVTANFGYNHFFVPGEFTFNCCEDPFRVITDIDIISAGLSFHRRQE